MRKNIVAGLVTVALMVLVVHPMAVMCGTWIGTPYYYEPETITYGAAITNNSGTISANDYFSVDQWVKREKANGTFANWLEFSPLAGNQTNASVVKLVTLPTFPTNLALTGLDSSYYTRAYGWSNYPGATFRYLTPGYNVQDINVAKPGICAYVTSYQVADSTGANALWGYWFASPFLYTFDAYALATDSYGLTEYFGNGSPQTPASQPCVLHGFIAVNQDLTSSQTAWIGNDPVSQSSATFSTSGNNNPFRILATQDAADQFPGSIGAYGIWQNNTTNQIRLIYKNLITLMQALGREPPPTNTLWVIPITGQSLALATGSVTNVSRGFYNFNDYVCDDGPISTASPGTGNHVGIQRARENTKVESIATASMLEAQVLGISNQVSMIEDTDGVGGGTFATIGPGSIYYKGCLALATNGLQYSNYFPTVICPAVFVVHGEADAGNAAYQSDLESWAGSFATDMKNATGQSTAPKLFHSQASAIPNSANAISDLAMLAETELANRSNILVCPKYFLPYYIPNTPHLNEHGYQRLAEYYGKAFYKEFFGGGGWQPLRPVSITRAANVITATFTNATGGLVLDTNSIFPLYTNQVSIGMATNYGFSYTNDSSPPAITSVAVSGATSNQVTITLASTPSGANEILYYAIWNAAASGDQGGTTNILFGNLRNNDPTKGALSTSNLWDWCVHFKKSIPF